MAYKKASGRAVAKYDKEHYKKATVKIPLEVFAKLERAIIGRSQSVMH